MGLIPSQGTKTMPHHAAKIEKKKNIYIYIYTHTYISRDPSIRLELGKKVKGERVYKSLQ